MSEENPYRDITDWDILEKLLPIALGLLEFNKKDKCYQWGDDLYQIYKYLEDKAVNSTTASVDQDHLENQETQAEETKEQQEEDHQVKIINEFHLHGTNTLNIYNQ